VNELTPLANDLKLMSVKINQASSAVFSGQLVKVVSEIGAPEAVIKPQAQE